MCLKEICFPSTLVLRRCSGLPLRGCGVDPEPSPIPLAHRNDTFPGRARAALPPGRTALDPSRPRPAHLPRAPVCLCVSVSVRGARLLPPPSWRPAGGAPRGPLGLRSAFRLSAVVVSRWSPRRLRFGESRPGMADLGGAQEEGVHTPETWLRRPR